MSQTHKADDYNLAQPSRSGRAGFESFKSEDGRFYFHFNAADGSALLYSQAYRREMDRDKGLQSVIKNAAISSNIVSQVNTEGGVFFVLRAGNKLEIARSRPIASAAAMQTQVAFFQKNVAPTADKQASDEPAAATQKTIFEAMIAAEPSPVAHQTFLASENAALKMTVENLEARLKNVQKSSPEPIADSDAALEPLRQVFRIEIYKTDQPERFNGKITHPISNGIKTFVGFDNQAIMGFIADKIQVELPKPKPAERQMTPTETPQYLASKPTFENHKTALPTAALAELSQLKLTNLTTAKNAVQANVPFEIALRPHLSERNGAAVGQACIAEVHVFALDTRQRYKLLEKRLALTAADADRNDVAVRVQPLILNGGGYRLTVIVNVLSSDEAAARVVAQWRGSVLLSLY